MNLMITDVNCQVPLMPLPQLQSDSSMIAAVMTVITFTDLVFIMALPIEKLSEK